MSAFYFRISQNPLRSASKLLRRYQGTSVLCRFCSSSNVPPLDQPLTKLAPPPSGVVEHVQWTRDHHETHVTTLNNGIKVASEESFGQFSTVGGEKQLR